MASRTEFHTHGSPPKVANRDTFIGVTWGIFFALLFVYRSVFSVLGELVIKRLTFIGDTRTFQVGILREHHRENFSDVGLIVDSATNMTSFNLGTALTTWIGGVFNTIFFGNFILINIGFQSLTFLGIVYLLLGVRQSARIWLAVLVMLPSFTVWTSLASKEAIIAGLTCLSCGYIVRMYYGRELSSNNHVLFCFSTLMIYIYKPYYLPAVVFLFGVTFFARHIRQKAFFALVSGLFSLALLFIFRDIVAELSFKVQGAFEYIDTKGRSTRIGEYFIDQYDVFWKAPQGMFQAFFGPNIGELFVSPLHLVTFVESTVVVFLLVFLLLRGLPSLPVYNVVVALFTIFWISFPTYSFGVMNVGSAIRYRSGWIIIIFFVIAVLLSRELYFTWRQSGSPSPHRQDGIVPQQPST